MNRRVECETDETESLGLGSCLLCGVYLIRIDVHGCLKVNSNLAQKILEAAGHLRGDSIEVGG